MSAVTEHSICAKNIQPHYNRSDKARERAGETFVPFHFSRFYVITRDTEFRYTIQPSLFPEGVCVTKRDLVCRLCVWGYILTMRLCFLPMAFLVYAHMCSSFLTAEWLLLRNVINSPCIKRSFTACCRHEYKAYTQSLCSLIIICQEKTFSLTLYVHTHTHSLTWGRICTLRHIHATGASTPTVSLPTMSHICRHSRKAWDGRINVISHFLFPLLLLSFLLFSLSLVFVQVLTTQKKKRSLVSIKDIVRLGIRKAIGKHLKWKEPWDRHFTSAHHPRARLVFLPQICFCVCLYVSLSGSTVCVWDHHRDFVFCD